MQIVTLDATLRPLSGKGPAARLRREGRIPAVAYGKDFASTPIAVSPKALHSVLESELGKNSVVELVYADAKGAAQKVTAMVRDYAFHPISRELLHADFVAIKLDQPVDVDVPFVCKGKAAGVVLGGIMRQVYRALPVRCLPDRIPTVIEFDVTPLELGDHVKAGELKLPDGVTVRLPAEQTVAGVVAPEKETAEETAAVPGAAAAPAAAGAAPAAAAGAKDDKKAAAPAAKDAKKK